MTQHNNNNRRHQHTQNQRNQNQRSQSSDSQRSSHFQYDPHRYQRQDLERELRQLNRRLAELDCEIDALFFQGQQLEADLRIHHQKIPATIALEIGRAVANAIRVPFLPPMYRNWDYERQSMLRAQQRLKYRAIELKYKRDALEQHIGQVHIDLDHLRYSF